MAGACVFGRKRSGSGLRADEVCCALLNTGDETVTLPQGSRLCQLIVEQIITPTPAWVEELEETARGAGGFGSTG
jgi:dUTP pyrophosphatase